MQDLLKMMEHCLLYLIVIFQVFLLFFLYQDPGGKGLSHIFSPSTFNHIFGRHQG